MNKPITIILCAGTGATWHDYLNIPKQLIPINNEPLLQRTVRLALKHSAEVVIVSWDDRMRLDSATFHKVPKTSCLAETFLLSRPLWQEQNVCLLGDVFFSQASIRKIFRRQSQVKVFGRYWRNIYTGCKYGELFGIHFGAQEFGQVEKAIELAYNNAKQGGKGKLWQVYRALAGIPLDKHKVENQIFESIEDITDDIDTPEDYGRTISLFTLAARPTLEAKIKLIIFLTPKNISLLREKAGWRISALKEKWNQVFK
ncbi:MAG: hypothetical protein HY781_07790 [Chloroflexi bacterium]|nr:hypothetical protein [Chloroflexota bacterium]